MAKQIANHQTEFTGLSIPTGLRPKAQGCEERATLGKSPINSLPLPIRWGPQCAKRKAYIEKLTRGGLGKPLGRSEGKIIARIPNQLSGTHDGRARRSARADARNDSSNPHHFSNPDPDSAAGLKARHVKAWGEAQRAEPQVINPLKSQPCKGETSVDRQHFLLPPAVLDHSKNCQMISPLLGDHVARSAKLIWGNQLVAGLGSHWAGVRAGVHTTFSCLICFHSPDVHSPDFISPFASLRPRAFALNSFCQIA